MAQILNTITQHLGLVNIYGFQNLLNNPIALLCIALGVICLVRYIKRKTRRLLYYVFTAFSLGYGTLLIDGAKNVINILKQINS